MPNYEFKVEMSCMGCVNALTNILSKVKGKEVMDFTISLENKKVTVTSDLPVQDVKAIVEKCGKAVEII